MLTLVERTFGSKTVITVTGNVRATITIKHTASGDCFWKAVADDGSKRVAEGHADLPARLVHRHLQALLLDETPEHCHRLVLEKPILTNEQLQSVKDLDFGGLRTKTLPTLFPIEGRGAGLSRALERLCTRAVGRVAFGKPLANLGGNRDIIANCRMAIDIARPRTRVGKISAITTHTPGPNPTAKAATQTSMIASTSSAVGIAHRASRRRIESPAARMTTSSLWRLRVANASRVPSATAEPPMSPCMLYMPAAALRLLPPVS